LACFYNNLLNGWLLSLLTNKLRVIIVV